MLSAAALPRSHHKHSHSHQLHLHGRDTPPDLVLNDASLVLRREGSAHRHTRRNSQVESLGEENVSREGANGTNMENVEER
jgi:hypothetical protein